MIAQDGSSVICRDKPSHDEPSLSEDDLELMELEQGLETLRDQLARLEEDHCYDCPRVQEMITRESLIARCRLRIIALEWRKRELIEDMQA